MALGTRNYIWQVSGYLQNEKALNGFHHNQRLQVRSKKAALIMLYKLWSGFTKNLRYLLVQKCHLAVRIPRFGTFKRDAEGQEIAFTFLGSHELAQHIECSKMDDGEAFDLRSSQQGLATSPDWYRIAQVSEVQNGDVAKMLVQSILAVAVSHARDGNHVVLNMKVGQLTFMGCVVKFSSTK